jgi:secreted trypsin-like serine protease
MGELAYFCGGTYMRAWRWIGVLVAAVVALTAAVGTPATAASDRDEIIGGSTAEPGRYPWVVRLSMGCAGTLIAPRVVLTAGHCVRGTGRDNSITITAGTTDLRDRDAIRAKSRYVVRAPGFRDATMGDDWALVQLAEELDLPLINRVTDDGYDRGTFTVMGWGSTREGSVVQQRHLREVDVPFVADRDCRKAYREAGFGFVSREMVCAGDLDRGGVDACQGDSGGPLVRRDGAGEWVQVGVVSWGYGCGRADYPGVYTQLSAFAEAIDREVRELSQLAEPAMS